MNVTVNQYLFKNFLMFYHQSRTSTPTRSDKEDKKSSELTHGTQESDLVVISKTNEVTFSKFDQD